MDFFAHQDVARRQTGRLILLFCLAVVCIVLAVYLVVCLLFGMESSDRELYEGGGYDLWNAPLFAAVSVATISIIVLGSLFKIVELSGGGEKVALMLGGRLLDPGTRDLAERRLLNVVEEMAIASGIPVPPVYVMDRESSINAFAAGYAPADAVVGVTRGTLEHLSRDELQGVVAHEFSHILNGDMRLNVRLIGLLNGILLLSTIGYILMRASGGGRRTSNRKNDSGAALVILGLALFVLGYIGVFFGRLIKASVSRQREFLADASAVQFTRQPAGLAGALKKIGGLLNQSRIEDAHADEASHLFFGDVFAGLHFNLLSTHPPLKERIRRIEPNFDGRFIVSEHGASRSTPGPSVHVVEAQLVQGLHAAQSDQARLPFDHDTAVGQIGTLESQHLLYASALLDHLSERLKQMVHEPYTARAVVWALLLDPNGEVRQVQERELNARLDASLLAEVQRAENELRAAGSLARLPLTEMAVPALKQLSLDQYRAFRAVVEGLVRADRRVALGEYAIWKFVIGQLDEYFGLRRRAAVRYHSMQPLVDELLLLLSMFAHVGHPGDERATDEAFQTGLRRLGMPSQAIAPRTSCTLTAFDNALSKLAQASLPLKRRMLDACAVVVSADGQTTTQEVELLRTVAELLGCPMPPNLPRMVAGEPS